MRSTTATDAHVQLQAALRCRLPRAPAACARSVTTCVPGATVPEETESLRPPRSDTTALQGRGGQRADGSESPMGGRGHRAVTSRSSGITREAGSSERGGSARDPAKRAGMRALARARA